MIRRLGRLSAAVPGWTRRLLVTALMIGAGTAAIPAAGADEVKSTFNALHLRHPAYAAVNRIEKEAGVFTGFPDGWLRARKPLTCYEFALTVQRIHLQLSRRFDPPRPGSAPVGCLIPVYLVPAESPRLHESFRNRKRLRTLLAHYEPMIAAFAPELRMLGADVKAMKEAVRRWRERPAAFTEKLPARGP